MIIKPSTALRNEYTEISRFCKESGEPVYLTKNGEGDLVVMAISAFEKQKRLLELKAKILEAEEQRLTGLPTYTHQDVRLRFAPKAEERANV
jgi:PHD/YefM family antitoxin component YafN of YafNO toxin-antitoxin module